MAGHGSTIRDSGSDENGRVIEAVAAAAAVVVETVEHEVWPVEDDARIANRCRTSSTI